MALNYGRGYTGGYGPPPATAGPLTAVGTATGTGAAALKPVLAATGGATGAGTATVVTALTTTGTAAGSGVAAAIPTINTPGSGSSAGNGTATAAAAMPLNASGTGSGSGAATGQASTALTAAGTGSGSGAAVVAQRLAFTATGSAAGDGVATAVMTAELTTNGTGTATGAAVSITINAYTSAGSGSGEGTASIGITYQLTTAGDSNGAGATVLTGSHTLAAFGTSTSTGRATLFKAANQAFWRNIKLSARVLESEYQSTVLPSTWSATVEAPRVKLSSATSDFVVVRITATQALDVNPPLIGLAATGYPIAWAQATWVQNSPGQLKTDDGRFYRDAQIFVGPPTDGNAQLHTVPGRSRVYWDLTDMPSHIVEPAGSIDVTGPALVAV